jgi:ATP-dependent Clp protease ATP-binding subunit ClpA
MKLSIPVYIRQHEGRYTVAPLFFSRPRPRDEKLERAMHLLAHELREKLHLLGKELRHEPLAAWSFCPPLDYHRLDLKIELRKRVAKGRFLFVVFASLGRRVAFTPSLPEVWFELNRGEELSLRAAEVLTAHFRAREKEEDADFITPESLALEGTAWISTLDLDIYPAQTILDPDEARRAAIGCGGVADGGVELFRVGRCLDQLYPDDLDRVLLREREVEELTHLLRSHDQRPVLILGPRLAGKTTLLHEYVWRTVSQRTEPYKIHNNVWLLSPQRLISGMSYVGQWENRLLAILQEARRRDHILYFDDFLGLYYAGQTSQSSLSVANILKPYIERREVRLVTEMTPEAFRVLRERDRGFADLFHVLPVKEPPERDTLRILIAVNRQLEGQHRCRFTLDVLPAVIDLQRRYVRHLSFPGKAATFLRRLAVKYRGAQVTRDAVLAEFQAQSGLALSFLDTRSKLERQDVLDALGQQIIGQGDALGAAADVISIAKARLNDPERPLASFLFLGPTGVGKTQCAKAVAHYLFGDGAAGGRLEGDRLLRFDMNEFIDPGSAARLAGTFDQPEGLLTSAVRRQPFAVILLDEIEKAHPEVFDLLLQVLGEGRLTDALGRTVDFSNTIIILTSNLGVRESHQGLGFQATGHDPGVFTRAAEKFFRPEFFNRLDRLVPFHRLGRQEVSRIASLLLQDVFQREGLVRRKCVLRIEPQALERVVDRGFDPVLGARALKRAIERQLTQPVAARLAAGIPETLTVISVYPAGEEITVHVHGLTEVQPVPAANPDLRHPEDILHRLHAALRRIEAQFAPLRPPGEITSRSLAGEHVTYFLMQEQVRALRQGLREAADALEDARGPAQAVPSLPVRRQVRSLHSPGRWEPGPWSNIMREMAAVEDIHQYLEELSDRAVPSGDSLQHHLLWLVRRAALLQVLADATGQSGGDRVLLYVWTANTSAARWVKNLAGRYTGPGFTPPPGGYLQTLAHDYEDYSEWWRLEVSPLEGALADSGRALLVQGLAATALTRGEEGTHLFCPLHDSLAPVQVHVWPVPDGVEPLAVLNERLQSRKVWQEQLATDASSVEDDPLRLQPVVRIYNEGGSTIDLRTGLVERTQGTSVFVLAALPLPQELTDL